MKKKYNDIYAVEYHVDYVINNNNISDKLKNKLMKIIEYYEPPNFYRTFIYVQTLSTAHNGIVYYGYDKNMKYQEIVGNQFNGIRKNLIAYPLDTRYHCKYLHNNTYITDKSVIERLNEIVNVYKIPKHLTDIYIINQNLENAHHGLVFTGKDKNRKIQYIYGKEFINERNSTRYRIFIKVYKILPEIEKYIKSNWPKDRRMNITNENLLAVLLQLELTTLMRTGKKKYLSENDTTGILTLKTENIEINSDDVIIRFVGKKRVSQYFKIEDNFLIEGIKSIWNRNNIFFFVNSNGEKLSERTFYSMMSPFGISLKNIRTYGVNRLILERLYESCNDRTDLSETKMKITINSIIKSVASLVGHSVNISKKSYISHKIINLLIDKLKQTKSFKDFLDKLSQDETNISK